MVNFVLYVFYHNLKKCFKNKKDLAVILDSPLPSHHPGCWVPLDGQSSLSQTKSLHQHSQPSSQAPRISCLHPLPSTRRSPLSGGDLLRQAKPSSISPAHWESGPRPSLLGPWTDRASLDPADHARLTHLPFPQAHLPCGSLFTPLSVLSSSCLGPLHLLAPWYSLHAHPQASVSIYPSSYGGKEDLSCYLLACFLVSVCYGPGQLVFVPWSVYYQPLPPSGKWAPGGQDPGLCLVSYSTWHTEGSR